MNFRGETKREPAWRGGLWSAGLGWFTVGGGAMGVIAAFEIEPPFVFNTAEHFLRLHRQADHPALKAIYDPYDACIKAKRMMDASV